MCRCNHNTLTGSIDSSKSYEGCNVLGSKAACSPHRLRFRYANILFVIDHFSFTHYFVRVFAVRDQAAVFLARLSSVYGAIAGAPMDRKKLL